LAPRIARYLALTDQAELARPDLLDAPLAGREREMVALVTIGASDAEHLTLNPLTVKTHVNHVRTTMWAPAAAPDSSSWPTPLTSQHRREMPPAPQHKPRRRANPAGLPHNLAGRAARCWGGARWGLPAHGVHRAATTNPADPLPDREPARGGARSGE
jgi:hypothetical protein